MLSDVAGGGGCHIVCRAPVGGRAHGLELPAAVAARQDAHHHTRVAAFFGKGIAAQLAAAGVVKNAAKRIFDLVKRLSAKRADKKDKVLRRRIQGSDIDLDHLIIAVASTGQIVAGMHDGTVLGFHLPEPDRVDRRFAAVENDARCVKVDIPAATPAQKPAQKTLLLDDGIPPEPKMKPGDPAPGLFQTDRLALGK